MEIEEKIMRSWDVSHIEENLESRTFVTDVCKSQTRDMVQRRVCPQIRYKLVYFDHV